MEIQTRTKLRFNLKKSGNKLQMSPYFSLNNCRAKINDKKLFHARSLAFCVPKLTDDKYGTSTDPLVCTSASAKPRRQFFSPPGGRSALPASCCLHPRWSCPFPFLSSCLSWKVDQARAKIVEKLSMHRTHIYGNTAAFLPEPSYRTLRTLPLEQRRYCGNTTNMRNTKPLLTIAEGLQTRADYSC